MKNNTRMVLLFLGLLGFNAMAAELPSNKFQKRFAGKAPAATESVNNNLYKPGKAMNYFWNSIDWQFIGATSMTYTPFGKLATQIDSGFMYRRYTYTYDGQQRQTEKLEQNFNPASQNWENSSRQLTAYNAQGDQSEYRGENWDGNAWVISYGNQNLISYNAQNLPTENLEKIWNSQDSAWVNEYLETEFVYDAQFRLLSYVAKSWDTTQWQNEEKSLWQYGADSKPNQVILQEWNGSAFVDSTKIINITWEFWSGNIATSMPSQYTMQKLMNGNWVNDERYTITMGANGSQSTLTEIFVGGSWVPSEKTSYLIDEQENPVHYLQLEYNVGTAVFDTVNITYFENSYDSQGRILQMIMYSWDTQLSQLQKMSKSEYSQHSMFTGLASAMKSGTMYSAVPNPVSEGSSFVVSGASGQYRITDLKGREMQSGISESGGVISSKGLSPGLYQIQFSEKGKAGSIRISVR